jgi:hypothetical protein
MHRRGEVVWMARKPEEALRWFTDARAALWKVGGTFPDGISKEDVAAFGKRLDERIRFLTGAGIQPLPAVGPPQR